jgi:FkbM family methyltransferase
MKKSWTLSFVRQWWPAMSLRSVFAFRNYTLRADKGNLIKGHKIKLQMRSPIRGQIILREVGTDVLTFDEVLVEQVYKSVLPYLRECAYVVDLGANIGLTSLYFASCYAGCKLIAVEPNPSTYDVLCANLSALVKAGRCKTLRAAIWGSETVLVADEPKNPEHYSAFATRQASGPAPVGDEISGMPLPQIMAQAGFERIDLLKVDVEGAEVELFKGDLEWLRSVECIAIEFHEGSREAIGFDDIMAHYGFRIVDTNPHTVVAVATSRR